ncbi:unnamed protein product [Knipowitschia caucasica]
MILHNISESDQGRYKCGTSGSEEFSEENLLQVKAVVLECPGEPVKEGESVTLSCRDKMAASNVTYSFYKDDKERAGSSTGELTLMEVSKTDEGVYKCKSSELRESEAQWLAVAERIVPRIVLSHQQYFQYTDLTVTCGGFFNNMTKWRVLRNIVTETKVNCYKSTEQFGACHLQTVYPSDSGEYWCESQDKRSEKVRITVSEANVILQSPVGSVVVGDNVSLFCITKIKQNTTFDFYKDGLPIKSNVRNGEMILHNISESDQGRYKCGTSGSKEFSEENLLKVKAVVLECPDEPVKEGESVTLSCRDKMAASYVTYSFYKDDKERTGSSTGELTLMEVSKTDEGVYKCKSSELRESEAQWLAVAGGISTSVHNASGGTDFKWSFLIVLVALLLLLLLGFIYRKYKGKCAQRQDSGHEVVEPQETCLYSQISNNNFDTQDINAGGQSADAEMLYASVNKKRKKQKQNCPDPVYSVVNKKKHKQAPSSSGSKVEKSV